MKWEKALLGQRLDRRLKKVTLRVDCCCVSNAPCGAFGIHRCSLGIVIPSEARNLLCLQLEKQQIPHGLKAVGDDNREMNRSLLTQHLNSPRSESSPNHLRSRHVERMIDQWRHAFDESHRVWQSGVILECILVSPA